MKNHLVVIVPEIYALPNNFTINHLTEIMDFCMLFVLGRYSINELLHQNSYCLYNYRNERKYCLQSFYRSIENDHTCFSFQSAIGNWQKFYMVGLY